MDFLDDENFVLSQMSVKEYINTQSAGFCEDVVEYNHEVVSLEPVPRPSFEIFGDQLLEMTQNAPCDGVAIEDTRLMRKLKKCKYYY